MYNQNYNQLPWIDRLRLAFGGPTPQGENNPWTADCSHVDLPEKLEVEVLHAEALAELSFCCTDAQIWRLKMLARQYETGKRCEWA